MNYSMYIVRGFFSKDLVALLFIHSCCSKLYYSRLKICNFMPQKIKKDVDLKYSL